MMIEIIKAMLPFFGAALAIVGIALMLAFAPTDTQPVLAREYSEFVKSLAAVLGPTAAAFIGHLSNTSDRPAFTAETPRHVTRAYTVSTYAGCMMFGICGGAVTQWAGVPSIVGYAAAAVGGFLGTMIVNVVFNRILDKWLPKGGS